MIRETKAPPPTGEQTLPPSGEQISIRHGEQHAIVVSVGAGLRNYTVDGVEVFDGYAADAMCDGARGQTLVPWPNRIRDGKWMWDGEEQQLALTEPEQHNAIHGLVRWLGWRVAAVEPDRVTFTCTSYPQPGYQWPLDIDVSYQLSDDGLAVTTGITNRGTSPAPVAAGAHPYLRAGTDRIDDCDLVIPANQWLPTGEQQIPTGVAPVESSPYDFRSARPIGDTKIDYAFADLRRGSDGRAAVVLRNRAGGHTTSLWVDESYGWIEVFTGDALPNPARRRQGLGVEPMTAPPNAFATGEGLITLTPQERWQGQWGIRAS